ncbi:MAG TPA: N-acetylmuramoyl-L-alanine amidase [Candidatus Acidoferrum sp.]|nr:N-acetylmuramoyl-L-alanine amidase [Candidatus Acidoferrum sp.]
MNRWFAWLVMLCLGCALTPAPAASVNGQPYVPLMDWARANGFRCSWLRWGDEIALTNRTTRLVFDRNSRTASINGVNVWLSFPVAVDRGTPYIAQLDLNTVIRPLISLPRPDARPMTTICIDPGHGGKDTGNHTFWRSEKTYTLALALELRDQLKRAGFNVILTRSKDAFVDLPDRSALANRRGADLFVSLHFNATQVGRDQVQGPETYCITPVGASSSNAQGEGANYGPTTGNRCQDRSLLLAYQMEKSLVRNLGLPDRGVRRARFAVLRDATMPAILIECGYMTHPAESKKIYNAGYRQQLAQAMVKGILAYQKLTVPPLPPRTSPPPVPQATRDK